MVNPPAIEVRLAELRDVPGLTALEARYYIGNVDPADRAGGFISVLHSTEWFAAAVDSGGVHVAVTEDDAVAGFIVMTAPPDRAAAGLSPIITAMLELAKTLEMNGRPIAAARYAFRGPVCIDESVRGAGCTRLSTPSSGRPTGINSNSPCSSSPQTIHDRCTPPRPHSVRDR